MNIVHQPRPLVVLGLNVWMGTSAGADELVEIPTDACVHPGPRRTPFFLSTSTSLDERPSGPLGFEGAQHRQTLRPSSSRDPQQSPASFRSAVKDLVDTPRTILHKIQADFTGAHNLRNCASRTGLPRLAGFYREGRSPLFFLVFWGGGWARSAQKSPAGACVSSFDSKH